MCPLLQRFPTYSNKAIYCKHCNTLCMMCLYMTSSLIDCTVFIIVEAMCRRPHGIQDCVTVEVTKENGEKVLTPSANTKKQTFQFSKSDPSLPGSTQPRSTNKTVPKITSPKPTITRSKRSHKTSLSFSPTSIPNSLSRSYDPNTDSALLNLTMEDFQRQFSGEQNVASHKEEVDSASSASDSPDYFFRPLLLFIPLRLGQEKFNMEYAEALKACFSIPQSVGVIGGKPRHALWFIGHHSKHIGLCTRNLYYYSLMIYLKEISLFQSI